MTRFLRRLHEEKKKEKGGKKRSVIMSHYALPPFSPFYKRIHEAGKKKGRGNPH